MGFLYKMEDKMKLKYRDDGTFRIMHFTDTHIGNMAFHEDDYKTFNFFT